MNLQLLREKRILCNLSQSEISKKLKISPKSYWNKETGEKAFLIPEAFKIKKILKLTDKEIIDIFFK